MINFCGLTENTLIIVIMVIRREILSAIARLTWRICFITDNSTIPDNFIDTWISFEQNRPTQHTATTLHHYITGTTETTETTRQRTLSIGVLLDKEEK